MKLLKGFPNTCQQLMDGIMGLNPELSNIKILNAYEMIRYLPNDMLLKDNSKMINEVVPMVYLSRFKSGKSA